MAHKDKDQLTALRKVKYLGSHPNVGTELDKIDIVFTPTCIRLRRSFRLLGEVPWSNVNALEADNREGVQKRVTATRIVLLGGFALLAQKETTVSYLIIEDTTGQWMFSIPDLSEIQLRNGLSRLQKYVSGPGRRLPSSANGGRAAVDGPRTITDRLAELEALRSSGLVGDDEYSQLRTDILRSI